MNNKEFIQNYPIELCLPEEGGCAEAVRKVYKLCAESYAVYLKEELGVKSSGWQYIDFKIHCETTGFAQAYFHFGLLYAEHVLPLWHNIHKSSKPTKRKRFKISDLEINHYSISVVSIKRQYVNDKQLTEFQEALTAVGFPWTDVGVENCNFLSVGSRQLDMRPYAKEFLKALNSVNISISK